MINCYQFSKDDALYSADNRGSEFISTDSIIAQITPKMNSNYETVGMQISCFNYVDNTSFHCSSMQYVEYDNLQNLSAFYVDYDEIYLFDIDNLAYTKSTKMPYPIFYIDGNQICSCRDQDNIYIFHSITQDYQTGVFVFNIKTNQFNNNDFWDLSGEDRKLQHSSDSPNNNSNSDSDSEIDYLLPKITNKFNKLHNLTVTACSHHNGTLLISWVDGVRMCPTTGSDIHHIAKYDYKQNTISNVLSKRIDYESPINHSSNNELHDNIFILFKEMSGYIEIIRLDRPDLESQRIDFPECTDMSYIIHYHDGKVTMLLEKYVDPYGQIYKESLDDLDLEVRSRKIVQYRI